MIPLPRVPALLLALVSGVPMALAAAPLVHHQLEVTLAPEQSSLQVHDILSLPPRHGELRFQLRAGLAATTPDADVRLVKEPGEAPDAQGYRLILPPGRATVRIDYRGRIDLPLPRDQAVRMGDQQASAGFITGDGVYLDGGSRWYPRFGDELLSFTLAVSVPRGWEVLSQGPSPLKKADQTLWEEDRPQEDIYLLAAPYHVYRASDIGLDTFVYLRSADQALASEYLSAMGRYVKLYGRLLGPYPYGKFAVVENLWETGYGMPSFTLLGPMVMRLPFLLHTSLPHEILHNWWGNGVYVDARQGNWSEGLTAYLADHLMREQAGEGADYRRNALLRYTNYVAEGKDFPLKDFQARHGEATQAIGYDKALMVFHMLRRELGDPAFLAALRRFYRDERFRRARWDDLRAAFESEAHRSLRDYFQQWLTRSGAPALRVSEARATRKGDVYEMSAALAQVQPGAPFHLRIPLAVQLDGRDAAWETTIDLDQPQETIHLTLPARPWRLAVDPQFDLFRRLDPGELPATLSEAFGAERLLMVLPAEAPAPLREGYRQLASAWSAQGAHVEVQWDRDLKQLPKDRAVWLLGWDNRFLVAAAAPLASQVTLSAREARVRGKTLLRRQFAVVTAAHRDNGKIILWLGSDDVAALPGLARKLPHYGSYSYLAFEGDAPTNVLKGQWNVVHSPLQIIVAQDDGAAAPDAPFRFAARAPLIASAHDK